MKRRIVDLIEPALTPKDTDETWESFSHLLVTSFGDIYYKNGERKICENLDLYIPHRMRELDGKTLDSLIYSTPPAFLEKVSLFGDDKDLTAAEFFNTKIHWASSSNAPFFILGYVGTGKSTFLDHYFYKYLPEENPGHNIIPITVNYRRASDTLGEFAFHILLETDRQIGEYDQNLKGLTKEVLYRCFAEDIANIRSVLKSPSKQDSRIDQLLSQFITAKTDRDIEKYKQIVMQKVNILCSKGKKVWLIIDNIDHHFYCLHQRALISGVEIAKSLPCSLIIAMRYITLDTPDAREVYDTFRPRKLKLSLPDIEAIVIKRLDCFRQLANDLLEMPIRWTGNFLKTADLVNDIRETTRLLRASGVLSKILLPLSNYNIRRLLDILLVSFQSYYFFYDRFNNERYLPDLRTIEKRFIYSHLLKNSEYYSPRSSDETERFMINMFENEKQTSEDNHFIRIRILQTLLTHSQSISLIQLKNEILSLFDYDVYEILDALRVFSRNRLITIRDIMHPNYKVYAMNELLSKDDLDNDKITVTLTHNGRLHYELMFKLEYIEIIKFSCYVDDNLYIRIQDDRNQVTFAKREGSTKAFLTYLNLEENKGIQAKVKDMELFEKKHGRIMPTIMKTIYKHIERIKKKL